MEFSRDFISIDLVGLNFGNCGFYIYLLEINLWFGGRNLFYLEYTRPIKNKWVFDLLFVHIIKRKKEQ